MTDQLLIEPPSVKSKEINHKNNIVGEMFAFAESPKRKHLLDQ